FLFLIKPLAILFSFFILIDTGMPNSGEEQQTPDSMGISLGLYLALKTRVYCYMGILPSGGCQVI
ncbi:MAG: hypothetical protein J6C85_04535, partial [Alphaproteobacteria bacterium]|nr:hypothetical protein [Alphaproteobacteria bacterium]